MGLYKKDPSFMKYVHLPLQDLAFHLNLPPNVHQEFFRQFLSISETDLQHYYRQRNISIITVVDPQYPPLLKHISDPPAVLFCKGNLQLLQNIRSLSVVGTRNPTEYGCNCIDYFIRPLARKQWTIVSGLALGIDAMAHWTAIQENTKTIAVIAGGLDHLYPKKNSRLADIISAEHLILSEYPPNRKPEKWMFPLRNRIISGLTMGTFVAQASRKSGSLITAMHALEQGRIVFSPLVPLFDESVFGNIQLLNDGASLVFSDEDIVREIRPMLYPFFDDDK